MEPSVFLLMIGMPLLTILLIFGMRYWAMAQQFRGRRADDQAHREIADGLASIQTTLAALAERLTAVEHILKQVE